ncbi:hypothetical protein PHMEG_00035449 [Phytophthora megakarya]|uniref:Chromo domain-containing protein n=1 Tax=Phytophthora megakarya TaxID=4795 RepID=A0A225URH9_9STRA|nr:hypothetical protein PHMEG_00035449 [Phytophthora megakarya]
MSRRAEDYNRKWKQLTDQLKEGFKVGDSPGSVPDSPRNWRISSTARSGSWKRVVITGIYRLQIEGTEYRFYPWVHASRLKPRAKYPDRPSEPMNIPEDDDFDAALLREDKFEVEAILDVRWVTRTSTSRRVKEYRVKWKGYEVPDWVPQGHLNCGRLLYEFDQGERARVRFQAMQSGDELPDEEVRGVGPESTAVGSGVSPRSLMFPGENTPQDMSEMHTPWGVDPGPTAVDSGVSPGSLVFPDENTPLDTSDYMFA